jgi:hypothetical protein
MKRNVFMLQGLQKNHFLFGKRKLGSTDTIKLTFILFGQVQKTSFYATKFQKYLLRQSNFLRMT